MPQLPALTPGRVTRLVTEVFSGYDHELKIPDGALYDTLNLSGLDYPLLATRPRRAVKTTLREPGGLLGKDALCHVDRGTLYINGLPTALTGLAPGEKQLVSMGATIVVFPDKRYCNTEDPADFGSLEADWSVTGEIRYAPCDIDGNVYAIGAVSAQAPADPQNGEYWLDSAGGTLMVYSAAQLSWTAVETVYTRVTFPTQGQLPALFAQGDGVEITGLNGDDLNGTKVLYALGGETERTDDYLVLIGPARAAFSERGTVRVRRRVPDMDFVCECQNRLWGCFYGWDGTQTLNEIYCSALGDFKNWRQYQGLATDSWTASVGSDGPWTGAINYLGHPTFFKEERIHTVTVSALGAHRLDETVCRGVQRGSHRSLAVAGETLFYKSRSDVCAWQGGFPQSVSAALGGEQYCGAVGGVLGNTYYLSMRSLSGDWSLFTYDIQRGLWYREDGLHATCFAQAEGELWCLDDLGRLLAMTGREGEREEELSWAFETGLLGYELPDKKYLSRYDLRLRMVDGGRCALWMEYDSSGEWVESGTVTFHGTGTATVPVRPRRCDHLRLRVTGTGEMKLFSIARNLEVGSDV